MTAEEELNSVPTVVIAPAPARSIAVTRPVVIPAMVLPLMAVPVAIVVAGSVALVITMTYMPMAAPMAVVCQDSIGLAAQRECCAQQDYWYFHCAPV